MAKKAELFDLQKSGRTYYETKNYENALDAFDKAVTLARKWSPSDVFAILDQRVAVHVKLGNVDLARKDAMSMIRTNKSDGRGYLRCGQLDRLEDDPFAALRWYEHGLKQVPESDAFRSVLKVQREKTKLQLDQKLICSNSKDPASTLPAELFQIVVTSLEYIETVKALRVSKSWRDTLCRLKPLIDTIDFSDAKTAISYKMMAAALKRLGPSPKVLITKDLAASATILLRKNLERGQNYTQMEQLVVPSTFCGLDLLPFAKYNLKSLKIQEGIVRDYMVISILKICTGLEIARFSNICGSLSRLEAGLLPHQRLRILDVGGEGLGNFRLGNFTLNIKVAFFAYFPKLEEIECHHLELREFDGPLDLSNLTRLRKLVFSACLIPQWPKLPPSIEVWENYDTRAVLRAPVQAPKLGDLGKLRCLRFHKTSRPPPSNTFLPDMPTQSITCIDIRNISSTPIEAANDEHFLRDFMDGGHYKSLRELAWADVSDWPGAGTSTALYSLDTIEILLLGSSRISGADLILLLKRPDSRLRHLTLIDCENISSGTIDWARSRGVTVHVKKTQADANSRRRLHF